MTRRLRDLCRPHSMSARCRPGEMRLEGQARNAIETGRNRVVITGVMFVLAFGIIGYRLIDLGVVRAADAQAKRAKLAAMKTLPDGHRAVIVDRRGVVLATSIRSWSIYADPALVGDADRTARILGHILSGLNVQAIRKKLKQKTRFVWIRRQATPRAYQQILRFGLAGVHSRPELRRIYPQRALVAHIVGSADVDNRGTAGVESKMDVRIRTQSRPLQLSLDMRAQVAVRQILQRSIKYWRALGGAAMIMDIKTGEIRAMVSLPDYDPYNADAAPQNARFNRNTLGVYELGSVFKVLNTAMALEYGVTHVREMFNVRRPLQIGRFRIRDSHVIWRPINTGTILIKSSNIGSAMIARRIGGSRQKAFLRRAGMLSRIHLELPEAGKPLFPRKWRPINTLTISFGHGIAVTPVHLVAAVGGVINDGKMVAPTLLKRLNGLPLWQRRIVSPRTSRIVRSLMRRVVLEGTGRRANAKGYRVGGKTGTAEKAARGGYRRKALLSSFIAGFPMNRPRYVVLVSVDEPKGNKKSHGYATAGIVAAPIVREIVERVAPILGVAQQADEEKAPAKKGWIGVSKKNRKSTVVRRAADRRTARRSSRESSRGSAHRPVRRDIRRADRRDRSIRQARRSNGLGVFGGDQ